MFNNRALNIKLVKTNDKSDDAPSTDVAPLDLELINQTIKEDIVFLGLVVVAGYTTITILNTISALIVNAAPKR